MRNDMVSSEKPKANTASFRSAAIASSDASPVFVQRPAACAAGALAVAAAAPPGAAAATWPARNAVQSNGGALEVFILAARSTARAASAAAYLIRHSAHSCAPRLRLSVVWSPSKQSRSARKATSGPSSRRCWRAATAASRRCCWRCAATATASALSPRVQGPGGPPAAAGALRLPLCRPAGVRGAALGAPAGAAARRDARGARRRGRRAHGRGADGKVQPRRLKREYLGNRGFLQADSR